MLSLCRICIALVFSLNMKLILVSDKLGSTKSIDISHAVMIFMAVVAAVCLSALFAGGFFWGKSTGDVEAKYQHLIALTDEWQSTIQEQKMAVEHTSSQSQQYLDTLSIRVAQLQARLLRIEAVGERVAVVAKLDKGEFDFRNPPSVGGPLGATDELHSEPVDTGLSSTLQKLEQMLESREMQLYMLEDLLDNRNIDQQGYIAGRPIKQGWMSSAYGNRVDPFTGKTAWHKGVDFAGKNNSDIIAVASGVVSWSGKRQGYGQMVEINHGNGYITRYGHNKVNKVSVGDVVKKGQTIAKMGSSGRSTGPHVHFEVYKNGSPVNPAHYIGRASIN